jgi:hypothetical protein
LWLRSVYLLPFLYLSVVHWAPRGGNLRWIVGAINLIKRNTFHTVTGKKKMSDWVIFLVGAVVTGIWGSVVGSLLYVAITDKKSGD